MTLGLMCCHFYILFELNSLIFFFCLDVASVLLRLLVCSFLSCIIFASGIRAILASYNEWGNIPPLWIFQSFVESILFIC